MAQQNLVQSRLSAEKFFEWLEIQELKYELVDGQPVLMAGADRNHNDIVMNATLSIGNQLKGKPCRPYSSDFAIKIPSGNIRYPDMSVDCGGSDGKDKVANAPALVIEVLSKSTRAIDSHLKLDEYQSIPSIKYILLVDQDAAFVIFHSRNDEGDWTHQAIIGLDSTIDLKALNVSISISDLYAGVQFGDRDNAIDVSKMRPR
jgi:Uma2 family endonuclease